MQIGRFRETRALRQPGQMSSGFGMEGQRLVFLYPMLCDQSLQRLLNDFRDFLTVSYIGEIKISNVLNITSDTYDNVGAIGSGNNVMNPAQMVRQAVWAGSELNQRTQIDQWTSQENRALYQDKINQFNHFLRNQIQHDPRYSKLRPTVSSITVERLINIPLIVGTQTYPIDSNYLYMILLVAISHGIPLDSEQNLKRIFSILDIMDKSDFISSIMDFNSRQRLERLIGYNSTDPTNTFERIRNVHTPKDPGRITSMYNKFRNIQPYKLNPTNVTKLGGWISNERSKSEVFFSLALNIDRWSAINGNIDSGKHGLNIKLLTIPTSIQQKHYDAAVTSFQQYVENIIIPIFNSLEIMTGPSIAGMSMSAKIEQFLEDVFENLTEKYIDISKMIVSEIQKEYADNGDSSLKSQINRIVDLCKQNSDIGSATRSTIDDLDNYIHLPTSMNGDDVTSFINVVKHNADKLNAKQNIIHTWLNELTKTTSNKQLHNLIQDVVTEYDNIIRRMFWNVYPKTHAGNYPWLQHETDPHEFANRYTNYCFSVLNYKDPSDIYRITPKAISVFYNILREMQISITKLLSFFFQWNFFSYTCSYMNDVEVDIEIQRRDALDFPNYCLVLPFDTFKGLYITKILRNFDKLMHQKKVFDTLQNLNSQNILPNINDVNNLINIVNRQLKIPNIILVDEKTNTCYYKFMYMSKPVKINLSALQSYIKHQKDVLPGF